MKFIRDIISEKAKLAAERGAVSPSPETNLFAPQEMDRQPEPDLDAMVARSASPSPISWDALGADQNLTADDDLPAMNILDDDDPEAELEAEPHLEAESALDIKDETSAFDEDTQDVDEAAAEYVLDDAQDTQSQDTAAQDTATQATSVQDTPEDNRPEEDAFVKADLGSLEAPDDDLEDPSFVEHVNQETAEPPMQETVEQFLQSDEDMDAPFPEAALAELRPSLASSNTDHFHEPHMPETQDDPVQRIEPDALVPSREIPVASAPQPEPPRPDVPDFASGLSETVSVPAPAVGRGAARAGRVKTRLLGFNPGQATASDPFEKRTQTASSGVTQFPVGWLIVVRGPGKGSAFTLFDGVSQIGRGSDQTICLDFGDNSISRENHAVVAYDSETRKFFLGHGGKSNLVRLQNRPVLSTEEVESGDTIRIGETSLRFVGLCGDDFQWQPSPKEDRQNASFS